MLRFRISKLLGNSSQLAVSRLLCGTQSGDLVVSLMSGGSCGRFGAYGSGLMQTANLGGAAGVASSVLRRRRPSLSCWAAG